MTKLIEKALKLPDGWETIDEVDEGHAFCCTECAEMQVFRFGEASQPPLQIYYAWCGNCGTMFHVKVLAVVEMRQAVKVREVEDPAVKDKKAPQTYTEQEAAPVVAALPPAAGVVAYVARQYTERV